MNPQQYRLPNQSILPQQQQSHPTLERNPSVKTIPCRAQPNQPTSPLLLAPVFIPWPPANNPKLIATISCNSHIHCASNFLIRNFIKHLIGWPHLPKFNRIFIRQNPTTHLVQPKTRATHFPYSFCTQSTPLIEPRLRRFFATALTPVSNPSQL